MNWSGGYKHRFRLNTEIRKTAFQQQSRIILVDLVKHDDLEQTGQISLNNGQKFTMIPPKVTANLITLKMGVFFKYVFCR
jgi:hypothetical protein